MRTLAWAGSVPATCDCCGKPIVSEFVDGKTKNGSWAFMCRSCWTDGNGVGKLGVGLGQRYVQRDTGEWLNNGSRDHENLF